MYYIAHASVKMATRKYGRNEHDMEVILRPDSEVIVCNVNVNLTRNASFLLCFSG